MDDIDGRERISINTFSYLGRESSDFGLRIEDGLAFSSPERDIQFEEIKGRDGDVIIDNQRLKSIDKSFPVTLFPLPGKTLSQQTSDISNWLKQSVKNTPIEVSSESDYVYMGMYYEKYSIDQFMVRYGKVVLNFKVMPYKFLKSGREEITLGTNIINPTNRPSRPKITIKGTGNITLKIGDALWDFKNVSGGIIVDTLLDVVTTLDGKNLAWDKTITYPLPKIAPGKQLVTKTGTITDIKIIPNWEAIVG